MNEERESGEDGDELITKLEILGNERWYIWKIFLLCSIPSIMNGLHLTSYVYLAQVPVHWCRIPELSRTNWTTEQIRLISSSTGGNESSCEYYNLDYGILSEMNFTQALEYAESQEKRELIPCSSYEYAEGLSSMVVNYDLVCDRTAMKSMIQVSLSFGKFLGAFLFGILSDKFGRRLSFFLGCFIYLFSGPMVAFAYDYWMVMAGRISLGAASSGIYNSAYIILSEIASKNRRAALGILYNMSYPLGQMIIPLVAYYFRDWRTLQIMISLPSLFVIIIYWFLPESPRWLLMMGKRQEAAEIIETAYSKYAKTTVRRRKVSAEEYEIEAMTEKDKEEMVPSQESEKNLENCENDVTSSNLENGEDQQGFWKKFLSTLNQTIQIFNYFELRSRLLIMLMCWCVCSLSYYALALNVDNFLADRYIYGFVTGLVEIPSYVLPLPMLKFFGRRQASIALFYVGGLALLAILVIPRDEDIAVLVVASIGRLCASAVFAVVILHTTELFPTLLRNTAIGFCSTAAHVGSMSAPLIVDILGGYAWFIPSTLCGVVTLLAGTMIFLLPETKNKPLPDTVEDIVKAHKNDKMGLHQICL